MQVCRDRSKTGSRWCDESNPEWVGQFEILISTALQCSDDKWRRDPNRFNSTPAGQPRWGCS